MKTINKKIFLAGLLAVAAFVPAEVGAFGPNLPKLFAMAPRMFSSAFDHLFDLLNKHGYKVRKDLLAEHGYANLAVGQYEASEEKYVKNGIKNVGDKCLLKQVLLCRPIAMRKDEIYGTVTEYGFKYLKTIREVFCYKPGDMIKE